MKRRYQLYCSFVRALYRIYGAKNTMTRVSFAQMIERCVSVTPIPRALENAVLEYADYLTRNDMPF